MSTSTWNSRFHRTPTPVAPAARQLVAAIGVLVARWYAPQLTRPLYHRMGAFDLARSSLAREWLGTQRR